MMTKIRLLILIITAIIVPSVATLVFFYAKGYRLNSEEMTFSPNGILVVKSNPDGAQAYINGELKTATNNTISLLPGTYDISIKREGFLSWEKRIIIEKEVVTQIDAFLLPVAPSLTPLTFSGAFSPVLSLDRSKIAYGVPFNADNIEKAGLWLLETVNLPLGFNREPRQVTNGDLKNSKWEFSPDGSEILLTTQGGVFLLPVSRFTPQNNRTNISSRIAEIKAEWEEESAKREKAILSRLPDELEDVFERKATNIQFSPDENRILYTASSSATLAEGLVKPLPGSSTQPQVRQLKEGSSYVYDIKEDKNFFVGEEGKLLYWLPDSLNIVEPAEGTIFILDYDGTNRRVVFAGNYIYPYAYPSTGADRLLILTNLGANPSPTNLYWLSLK